MSAWLRLSASRLGVGAWSASCRGGRIGSWWLSVSCRGLASSLPDGLETISMPALSPTMTEGNLTNWILQEGDHIAAGDAICEIETDKAVVALESQEDGYLARILVAAGTQAIPIGKPLALMAESTDLIKLAKDVDAAALLESSSSSSSEQSSSSSGDSSASSPSSSSSSSSPRPKDAAPAASAQSRHSSFDLHSLRLSPGALHTLLQHDIDPSTIRGTGRRGLILKQDVLGALKGATTSSSSSSQAASTSTSAASPSASASHSSSAKKAAAGTAGGDARGYTDLPHTNMRKVIAQRLSQSKSSLPHLYATVECEVDSVLALRRQLKAEQQINVSVNDFIIKAVAAAIKQVPEVNATWDAKSESVRVFDTVDISVAVATEGGLITPIVERADTRGLTDISAKVKDLAKRARENKLKLHEFQGGSFTISNLGMYGVTEFSAVINMPQSCILAVSSAVPRLMLDPNTKQPTRRSVMCATLSADARVVDEQTASRFLRAFSSLVKNPAHLLL